ncbi:MAG TPA: NAD(P)-dependent alcohol dehydrogenase [Aggregatilineales bacterium]|nr:NAD(P)-dependent alcohol dehydrogenase [Aggregatilineales bacterium]
MLKTQGYAAPVAKAPLAVHSFERREPRENDVVVEIQYCGICHSDIHQVRNEWGEGIFPMVPGHEITGIVTTTGSKVTKYKVGDKVGVGVFVDSCRACKQCKNGLEQYCTEGFVGTYNGREYDGTPTIGGYSDKIVVDENYVFRIPNNLPLQGAAPLLCAGITTYSPLLHWHAASGMNIAIIGLGGLGHMGVKFAHALGAEVTVLSHSLNKQADGNRLGADQFYATSDRATFKKLRGTFDLMINTVSADIDWNQYLKLLKVDGTMVVVGLPEKQVSISASTLVDGRRSIAGSMIGSLQETQQMLDFCGEHNIVCDVEMVNIQDVNAAYERVLKSDVKYRFVIDMASLKS